DDAASAWLKALDIIDTVKGRIFNLGGGPENAISLRELLALIGEFVGRQPQVRYAEWRPGDQPWYVSDIRAISKALAWSPQVAFREGAQRLTAWLQDSTLRTLPPFHAYTEARV